MELNTYLLERLLISDAAMRIILLFIALFANMQLLSGCDARTSKKSSTHIITAQLAADTSHLYYTGVIAPLHTVNINSPAEGVVQKMAVHYGDWVQAKQPLLIIRSTKSQKDYAASLTDYLTKKDQYTHNETSFAATSALYQAGIVAKETYLREKSQLETSKLAFLAASSVLQNLQDMMPDGTQDLTTLDLEKLDQLENSLQKPFNEFTITSPITGILLMPQSATSMHGNDDKPLAEGCQVKENQLLASLGDMTGISTTIHVNETDINQIALHQTATLTSWALPGMVFHGVVTNIARQSSSTTNQNSASFPVQIAIPTISALQQKLVHIGMTAKIDIEIHHPPHIKIPINAVFEKDGLHKVMLMNVKTKKPFEVTVETGATDISHVSIISGLKPGDQVLVRDD